MSKSTGTVNVVIKKISTQNVTTTLRTVGVGVTYGEPFIYEIVNEDENPDPVLLKCDGSTYTLEYVLDNFNAFDNSIKNSCSSCNQDLGQILPFLSESLQESNDDKANGFLVSIDGLCDLGSLPCSILNNSPELLHTFGDLVAKRTKMQVLQDALSSGDSFRLIANSNMREDLETTEKQYYSGLESILKRPLPKVKESCFCLDNDHILGVS